MAERLTLSTIFDAGGNLVRKLRENGREVSRFVTRTNSRLKLLDHGARAASRGFSLLRGRVGAMLAAAGTAAGGRYLVGLEERFTRLAVQAGKSDDEINKLKQTIFDVSQAGHIRIDPEQLTAGVAEIVERTGDLKFAEQNLENIAMAIQATGAQGSDIGALVAEFKKLGITTERDVLVALDTLTAQGKAGAFTLGNLATQGARVVSAMAGMGYKGQDAIKTMGALLQIAMMGTGAADRAATAYEAMLRQIKVNAEALEKEGIIVRDPAMLAKGIEQFRAVPEILDEIIKKSKGSSIVLQKIFGDEGLRAINQLGIDFKQSGGLTNLNKFLSTQGDGNQIISDSARIAKTASATITDAWSKLKEGTDRATPALKVMANTARALIGDGSPDMTRKYVGRIIRNESTPEATVRIQVDGPGRIRSIQSKGINVDADTGRTMESP